MATIGTNQLQDKSSELLVSYAHSEAKPSVENSSAAIKLQSVMRGYFARLFVRTEKSYLLSYFLFEKAKKIINSKKFETLKRAPCGKTPVYLPKKLPVVLKESGEFDANVRLSKMKDAQEVCIDCNFSSLKVPRARVYKKFIIESRLPIKINSDTKYQIGLYLENLESFTKVAREFTEFLCQTRLSDIVGGANNRYNCFSQEDIIPRYDNLAIYILKEQGYMGLVDLERFSLREKITASSILLACKNALAFFPHHFETILKVAKSFNFDITGPNKQYLENQKDESLNLFKKIYVDHLDFLKEKNINLENPFHFVPISHDRKGQIQDVLTSSMRKIKNHPLFKEYLGRDSETTIRLFNERAFPSFLDSCLDLIQSSLDFKLNIYKNKKPITCIGKLLEKRTFECDMQLFLKNQVVNALESKLGMITIKDDFFGDKLCKFSLFVINVIFKELQKGKEIAFYHPGENGIMNTFFLFC